MDRNDAGKAPHSSLPRVRLNDFEGLWSEVRSDVLAATERVGASGRWILGPEVSAFEDSLAAAWGIRHAIGCANGLDAIEMALRCLGLERGEPVLTTPFSAFATTLAIVRAGGVPVFSDVDSSGLLDLRSARGLLESRSDIRFLVPVHLYGHAMDLRKLESLKKDFNLRVVEDCAQSIGARSFGRPCGSVGEFAATSFYPTKNLGAMGDGGALLTNSPALAAKARILRDYGQSSKYVHIEPGLNSRLDELQAAILADVFLPRLPVTNRIRRAIGARYLSEIRTPALEFASVPKGSESVWHLFPVLVRGDRGSFMNHLDAAGIESAVHYPRMIPSQEAMKSVPGYDAAAALPSQFPVLARFCAAEVSLPIHPLLSENEVDRVVSACNGWRG